MKLLKPLELQGCRTAALNMVPSKEYFKPVLIIDGPLTIEMVRKLHAEWKLPADMLIRPYEIDYEIDYEIPFCDHLLTYVF